MPVNRLLSLTDQVIIGLGEMFAPQKTAMGGQRGRMWRTQNEMPGRIDNLAFFLRVAAPQQENQMLSIVAQMLYDTICKGFPATPLMRGRLTRFNGQHTIQKNNAMLRSTIQATFTLSGQLELTSNVVVNLLVYILQ